MGTKLSDYLARSKAAGTAEDAALRKVFASAVTAELPNAWTERARGLLEEAVGLLDSREDVLMLVDTAGLCLRAEANDLPADDLASLEAYFAGPVCICPPDLRARGGYRGGCPAEH